MLAVILIIASALAIKKSRRQKVVRNRPKRHRLDYQPEVKQISPITPAYVPPRVQNIAVHIQPEGIDIINGRADITDSLVALVGKYSLETFTIATSDGLVLASSGTEIAQDDAAQYSEMYIHDPLSKTPGVNLFGLNHKGSDLVGIIRSVKPVIDETCKKIIIDTKDILNKWL